MRKVWQYISVASQKFAYSYNDKNIYTHIQMPFYMVPCRELNITTANNIST